MLTKKRLVVLGALIVLAGGIFVFKQAGDEGSGSGSGDEIIVFAPVERRTLQDVLTVQGEVRHEELGALNMLANGRVTGIEVEEGDTVDEGRAVFAVDGRPAIAAKGDFPFWRPLEEGSVGFDVYQLELILERNGYSPGAVDLDFTGSTRDALVRWQRDHGYSATEKEPDETVTVQLQQTGDGYTLGNDMVAAGRIVEQSGGEVPESSGGIGTSRPRWGALQPKADPLPKISIAASPTSIVEGEASRLIFTSDRNATADLTIRFAISGSATPGDDYDALSGEVELETGESRVELIVPSFADDDLETDETVVATLTSGTGYAIGGTSRATITLTDQTIAELTIDPSEISVTEGGTVTVNVVSDQALLADTQVEIAIGGEAVAGDPADPEPDVDIDYVELEDTLLMSKGSTSKSIRIETLPDSIIEGDEEITIQITAASFPEDAYEVGDVFEATVTIEDDADLPTLTIEEDSETTSEGTPATFTVTSDLEITGELDVSFVVSGSVTVEDDYPEPDETFAFAASDETTLSITTTNDDDIELDETLWVTLLPGEGYEVGELMAAATTIESEDVPELGITGGGTVSEGGTMTFVITADKAPVEDTTVVFTASGTAQMGTDFEALEGLVVLPAGATSVTISVLTIDDDARMQPGDFVVGDWPTRIGQVRVDEGEFLTEGMEIMQLTEDELTVTVRMSPSDRTELTDDLPATVELAATGATAPGNIIELSDAPDVSEGGAETYSGEVTVEGELTVVDGATVNVDVVLLEATDAIVIPVASLVSVGGGTEVRVVADDGSLQRTEVVTGLTEGAFVEVVDGLEGDEQVVVEVKPA